MRPDEPVTRTTPIDAPDERHDTQKEENGGNEKGHSSAEASEAVNRRNVAARCIVRARFFHYSDGRDSR
jgi:hypothetical protein